MNEVYFDIVDDVVIKYTPIFKDGLYEKEIVMTKEIFQECYKKWIEPQELEENNIKEGIWLIDDKQDEYDEILDEYYSYCSNCHTAVYTDIDPDTWAGGSNYCPVCGARMKNRQSPEK